MSRQLIHDPLSQPKKIGTKRGRLVAPFNSGPNVSPLIAEVFVFFELSDRPDHASPLVLGALRSVHVHGRPLEMTIFDYGTKAELSPRTGDVGLSPAARRRSQQPTGYGRFARAADAIRFAIEELPFELLLAAQLKVAEERFDSDGIRRLYESVEYPLARRPRGDSRRG
jgi:hypothetical protein